MSRDIKQTVIVNIHDKKPKKKKRKPRKRKAKKDDKIQGLIQGTGGSGGFSPSQQTYYRPLPNYNPYSQFYIGPAANNFDNIATTINEKLSTISKTNLLEAQKQDDERKRLNQERMIKQLEEEERFKTLTSGGKYLYGELSNIKELLKDKTNREVKQIALREPEIEQTFYELGPEPEPEPEEPAAAAAAEPEPEEEEEDEPEGTIKTIDSPALENQSKEVTNQILDATSSGAFQFPTDDEIMMPKSYGKISVVDAIDDAWSRSPKLKSGEITNLRKSIVNAISNAKSNKDAQIIAKYRKEVFDRYLKTKK